MSSKVCQKRHFFSYLNGIGFKSLTENIDTTTSGGKLIFHIFGALAEFERDIIKERTTAGLTAARARGRQGDGHDHHSVMRESYRWRGKCMKTKTFR
jgi:DNA invertase Pin-like site-specific DNA recombinase